MRSATVFLSRRKPRARRATSRPVRRFRPRALQARPRVLQYALALHRSVMQTTRPSLGRRPPAPDIRREDVPVTH